MGDLNVYVIGLKPSEAPIYESETKLDELRRLVSQRTSALSRQSNVVATARFKSSPMQVVFLEKPSKTILHQLLNGKSNEPRFEVIQESKEILRANEDWTDYEQILKTHLFKWMLSQGKNVKLGRQGNLEVETGVFTVVPTTTDNGKCNITRILRLSMTKVEPEKNLTNASSCLLVHFDLTHELRATKTVHELISTTWNQTVREKVEVRSLGGFPVRTGLLCREVANTTISSIRPLGAQNESLLDYNRRVNFKRRELLRSADPSTSAVCMQTKGRKPATLPYPPQILEPLFRKKDMSNKDYKSGTNCNATEWLAETAKVAKLLLRYVWPEDTRIQFLAEFFKPKCQNASEPELQNGPVLNDPLHFKLVFPSSLRRGTDAEKILETFKTAASKPPFCDIMPTPQVSKLCFYSDQFAGRAAANLLSELSWEQMIQQEKTIVIGILPEKKSDEEVTKYRKAIKNAAHSRCFASQCVKFQTILRNTFACKNIMSGILAKLGSQFKMGRSGSKPTDMSEHGTYHVSFDVSRINGVDIAAYNIFGSDGIFLETREVANKGETLSPKFIDELATGLERAKLKKGEEISRVSIARDGRFQANEIESLRAMLDEQFDCRADFVEVTKSGPDWVRMLNKRANGMPGMPKSGCYWKIRANTAVLCTIGSPKYTGSTGLSRYPQYYPDFGLRVLHSTVCSCVCTSVDNLLLLSVGLLV